MIVRHLVVLTVAVGLTLMIFFGAGYFGAVWTHYFTGAPEQNTGEVTVKIVPAKSEPSP